MDLARLLLGRRLSNRESDARKIGAFEGVPAMGLDALGSSAYGPEAALTILMALGAAGVSAIGPIMVPIVALLAVLFVSYWQTLGAYPNNGGAYLVARENLGDRAGLLAATALMIDYVLNVAVGISAGVGALVSAVPILHPHTLVLCLGILLLITLINLRGTLESGRLLAAPTYLFVASFAAIIVVGVVRSLASGGAPAPVAAPPALPGAVEAAGLWLLLRAFASGCTAMTGVEAVSNGIGAFREPRVKYGRRTLAAIVAILAFLLAGIAYLSHAYRIGAMDQSQPGYQSVLSQLAGAVVGHGVLYYVAIGALLAVLTLSANTSFVGFPRLCRAVAADGFLPKPFAIAGRRLVFSVGLLYLAACAALLLVAFGGITDRLIPLFAVGAFLSFTLSQSGMVVHWRRALRDAAAPDERRRARVRLAINAVGASATAAALAIIVVAKFEEGAWITLAAIPCTIALLRSIRGYYDEIERLVGGIEPLDLRPAQPPIVIVTVENWNRLAAKAVQFGLSLSPDVVALHLTELAGPESEEHEKSLRERWLRDVERPAREAGVPPPRLMVLRAQYRTIQQPVLKLVQEIEAKFPQRRIAVLVPEVVKQRWYQQILHTHRARHLRARLLAHGGSRITVVSVPWHLDEARDALAEAAAEAAPPESLRRRA